VQIEYLINQMTSIFDIEFSNKPNLCLCRPANYELSEKVTVSSIEFFRRLDKRIGEFFDDDFNWSGVIMAGGLISGLIEKKADVKEYEMSDIDLFVYDFDLNEHQIKTKMVQIYNYFVKKLDKKFYAFILIPNTTIMNIIIPNKCSIQIIGTMYKYAIDVLKSFDLTHCQIGFNGYELLYTDNFIIAIQTKTTRITKNIIQLYRLVKAYRRGYSVIEPDKCLVCNRFQQSYPSNDKEYKSYNEYLNINELSKSIDAIINDPIVVRNLTKNYVPNKLPVSVKEAQEEMQKIAQSYVGKTSDGQDRHIVINDCNKSTFIKDIYNKFGFERTYPID